MKPSPPRSLALAALALACAWGVGCTDASLEPPAELGSNADDQLSLSGTVCTAPPDPTGFPVKVMLLVDESGSMCVSDPPGSQEQTGFCERADVQAIIPPGVTEPARVRALKKLIAQFQAQPNVEVSIVPFETNVKNTWPSQAGQRFSRPLPELTPYLSGLQSQLGKGTDYQGALAYAYATISSDIVATAQSNPAILPRTRYVVVFLTDGVPFPRCSANDQLSVYAGPNTPELTWADSLGAGDFCNLTDPGPDQITGFVGGTDRNQNYQLFGFIDQLMQLRSTYNIGDLRLHTVLLFNTEAVRACGTACEEIYGSYAGVPAGQYPEAAKKIAAWTLQRFAERGNGVYQEFNDFAGIGNLALGALDYSSLASRNVMKSLRVQSLSSTPSTTARVVDTDGDGLPDSLDNGFTFATSPFETDSDGDCFSDQFEARRSDLGFKPGNDKDSRGCDPASPLTLGCSCRDTDGDGLSQFAEDFLGTHKELFDSDGDGMSDGLEALYKLDPLKADAAGIDTDGDGVPDRDELLAGSDPTVRDALFKDRLGYQYQSKGEVQADGRVCYQFNVSNLKLVTPPSRAGARQGFNLFKLYFGEAPESGVSTDYGVWKTACAWAQYDAPFRDPSGPELTFRDSDFRTPSQLVQPQDYLTRCVGRAP